MKVVIAGAGSVGRYMANQLLNSGHDVTLIEQSHDVATRYRDAQSALRWHVGDACDLRTLADVGLPEVDVLAAATGDDEDNLVISLLAKQEFGVPRVVARVNNPDNEWLFTEMWGVDLSVSTPHLLTALVEEAVSVGSYVRLLSLAEGRVRLSEITLAEGSPVVGVEIGQLGLPREATVVAVVRNGNVMPPHADTVLRDHDEVLILVQSDTEDAVRQRLVG